jgi:hypothetical protein
MSMTFWFLVVAIIVYTTFRLLEQPGDAASSVRRSEPSRPVAVPKDGRRSHRVSAIPSLELDGSALLRWEDDGGAPGPGRTASGGARSACL